MRLFKYRPIGEADSDHRRALREIICEGKLWFSRPSKFDDRLDCRPLVQVADSALMRRWLVNNRKVPALNPQKPTSAEVTAFMIKHQDGEWLEHRWFDVTDRITGVCCLSSDCNLDFQWENYGNAHRGVCIELEADQHVGGIEPRPVVYDDTRPVVHIEKFVTDENYRNSKSYEVLTRKSTEYQSENEYRILTTHDEMPENGINHTFNAEIFKKVYLGRNISNEHVVAINSLVDASPIQWEVLRR